MYCPTKLVDWCQCCQQRGAGVRWTPLRSRSTDRGGSRDLPHGFDVAYSTVITSEIREKLLSQSFGDKIYRLGKEEYEKKMQEVYKGVAGGCIDLQNKIGNYKADHRNIYKEKETEIKQILAEAPSAKEIQEMFSLVGLDMSEFYTLYNKKKINQGILYAKDLKDRYTVLWVNYDYFGEERE